MAKNLIPRPMRAKNLLVKDDPQGQAKNFEILERHLKRDGFLLQQPKIDGMRILFDDGIARSRSWTPWTNRYLQAFASMPEYVDLTHGWDCEGLPGLHTSDNPDPEVFRRAMSGLRSQDGSSEMTLFLFDNWDASWQKVVYQDRLRAIVQDLDPKQLDQNGYMSFIWHNKGIHFDVRVIPCPTKPVYSIDEIMDTHLENVALGWEGSMLRRWCAPYKWNQATINEGWLIKIKDVEDAEAIIYGFEPAYANENEAMVSPLGFTKRSSHQANLVPKDYLGAWLVHDINNPDNKFKIGVLKGYSIEDRRVLLRKAEQGLMNGKIIKYEHQGYGGGYDKPRAPVGISLRDPIDL